MSLPGVRVVRKAFFSLLLDKLQAKHETNARLHCYKKKAEESALRPNVSRGRPNAVKGIPRVV